LLFLAKAQKIALRGEGKILLQSNAGPLIVLFEERRKVVYAAFNVLDTDMPFRVTFPALLRNIMTYFETDEYALLRSSYITGEAVFPARRLPEGTKTIEVRRITTGDEAAETVKVSEGSFLYGNTSEPGYYRFTIDGRDYFTTVNVPHAESDIAPTEAGEGADARISTSLLGREMWFFFAIFAALFFMVEWFLFNRRITE
jgi:hypothetical protein